MQLESFLRKSRPTLMAVRYVLAMAILLLGSGHSIASGGDYLCVVKYVGAVGDDGRMESQSANDLLRRYIGSEFQVSKLSGRITGEFVSNTILNAVKTEVIDPGGAYQSYKVISTFGPNIWILYLQINDYPIALTKDGLVTFTGFRWQEVISGTCRRS